MYFKKSVLELSYLLVEGNSALGPYLYVRDKETQAVLPIRGKILNTTYKNIKEVIQK